MGIFLKITLLSLLITISTSCVVTEQVEIVGIEVYPLASSSRASALYKVEVLINGVWVNASAYQHSRKSLDHNWYTNQYPFVHWTTIGLADSIETKIKVTRLNRSFDNAPFSRVEILPSRYNIKPRYDQDTITFSIKANQKVYVRTNDQDKDTLFITAGPLKPSVPAGALYFGPGERDIGFDYQVGSNYNTIYLDAGAWVKGSFDLSNVSGNFKIMGPGVLSGELMDYESIVNQTFDYKTNYTLIHTNSNSNSTPSFDTSIQGITLVASPFYNIYLAKVAGKKDIEGVNIISPWTYNTDGFNTGSKTNIKNSFVFNNDDTVFSEYSYNGDVTVSDCVLAGRNAFLIGYGYFAAVNSHQTNIKNVDLILQGLYVPFRARVDGRNDRSILVDNQTYENIVIDGDVKQLVYLAIEDTDWGASNPATGNVKDIIFKNIIVNGVQTIKSEIKSKDSNNKFENIVFENVFINGTHVDESNYTDYFTIDDESTVTFK